MKWAVAIAATIIGVGLYLLVFTPDVVTQHVEVDHSHDYAVLLVLVGGVFGLMGAIIADMVQKS